MVKETKIKKEKLENKEGAAVVKGAKDAKVAKEIKKVPKKEKAPKKEAEVFDVGEAGGIKETKEPKTAKEVGITKEAKDATELKADLKPERYWEAVGRRKTAVARVRLFTRGDKGMWVNDKPYGIYFPTEETRRIAEDALKKMKAQERFRVMVKANGGGLHAQAEAVRHGTSRALTKFNPDFRKRLKRAGFLTRDPRMVERKKFGLHKARKAPQWAKR